VGVVKNRVTVGHIPRKISSVCSLFLCRNGRISICTIEKRRFSEDLPQGGLEIPCILSFEGASKEIQKNWLLLLYQITPPPKAVQKMMNCNPTRQEEQKKTA